MTDILKAFLVGGIICVIGQLLIDLTKLTPARIMVCFVVLGVVLGFFGLYQPLVEWGGAGASVPLIGFGNTLVKIDPSIPTLIKVNSAFGSGSTPDGSTIVFGDHTQKIGEGDQILTIEANVVFGKIDIIEK